MFSQVSVFSVVWTMLLKIWFLNNAFWNHLGPIFEQQTMLSSGRTINTFKPVGPTWCDKLSLSSLLLPMGPTRKEETLMRKEGQRYIKWISSLSSNKIYYFIHGVSFFKNQTHTYQTHILCFSNTEICYLNHHTKHLFCFMNTKKHVFQQYFFKP